MERVTNVNIPPTPSPSHPPSPPLPHHAHTLSLSGVYLFSRNEVGQTLHALNKVKTLLESEGMSEADLVKVTLHVSQDADMSLVNQAYQQFFSGIL